MQNKASEKSKAFAQQARFFLLGQHRTIRLRYCLRYIFLYLSDKLCYNLTVNSKTDLQRRLIK